LIGRNSSSSFDFGSEGIASPSGVIQSLSEGPFNRPEVKEKEKISGSSFDTSFSFS